MAIHRIRFQRGLSLPEFQSRYGSKAQCKAALVAARWPGGWRCAHCGCSRYVQLTPVVDFSNADMKQWRSSTWARAATWSAMG